MENTKWFQSKPYWLKGGIIGLIIGIIIDFTPLVFFTIFWRAVLGDSTLARNISWITFPTICLITGASIGLIISKIKSKK